MSSFVRDLKIYGFADFISKVISLAVSPLLTRILSLEQFGAISLLNAIWQPISVSRYGGMDSAYPFFQADDKDGSRRKEIISTASIFSVFFVFLTAILFATFEFTFHSVSKYSGANPGEVFWFILSLLPSGIVYWLIYTLRFLKEPSSYVRVNFIGPILSSVASIPILYLFVVPEDRLVFYFAISFFINLLSFVWAIIEFKRLGVSPFSYSNFSFMLSKKMLRYGISLIPATILYSLMTVVNRLQVGWYLGPDEVAILQLAIMLSAIGTMLGNWFGLAFDPHLLDWITHLESKEYTERLQEILSIISLLFVAIVFFSSIWSHPVIEFLYPGTYLECARLLPILLMGVVFSTLSRIGIATVLISKKPLFFLPTRALALILSSLLGYILIPRVGLIGAAFSSIAGEIFILLNWIYLGCFYFKNLNLKWGPALNVSLLGLLVAFFMPSFQARYFENHIPILLVLSLLFSILFYVLSLNLIGKDRLFQLINFGRQPN